MLPAGVQALATRETPLGTYGLPVGLATKEGVPQRLLEGRILRQTWRIQGDSTVLQILAPLREQLQQGGYDILFQCEARQCGGFDFRFGIEVVPAPDMAVSIGNYHFLSAVKGPRAISLLVSRSGTDAYLQVIEVLPPQEPSLTVYSPASVEDTADIPADATAEADLGTQLLGNGHAILGGLDFATGTADLQRETYESLEALADFLTDNPQYSVVVVGHTDTVGQLEDNIALSRRRAEAVKAHLVETKGISEGRIGVEGVGYLAPIGTNLTSEGRVANRRVEAVLVPRERP
ncbi:OmpA family protein [Phycobacter sp. K97]|uniref:OmpA family protein n=1 Tax=Phycobacter sedimenti TaxID=3133977 RepID=UPI00311EE616